MANERASLKMSDLPRLLFTMGDVAGIGPEIIARAWPELLSLCRPVVIGDPVWLQRALDAISSRASLEVVTHPTQANPRSECLSCIPGSDQELRGVVVGRVSAAAGR